VGIMAKGKRRTKALELKLNRKRQSIQHPSGKSQYARKATYLNSHNLYGFQVAEPKPWK